MKGMTRAKPHEQSVPAVFTEKTVRNHAELQFYVAFIRFYKIEGGKRSER